MSTIERPSWLWMRRRRRPDLPTPLLDPEERASRVVTAAALAGVAAAVVDIFVL